MERDPESGCWIWIGAKTHNGYGRFGANGRLVYAHRFLFELAKGAVPVGLEVHHICRRRACVNPSHLEAVTHSENMRRAAATGVWDGSRNGFARRTEEEVLVIKILNAFAIPATLLALVMAIPQRSVYSITRRERWKHLEPDISAMLRDRRKTA